MNQGALVAAAFATGVVGSGHCVAMCGGIAGSLAGGIATDLRRRPAAHLARSLAYSVGRVSSYALVGAAVGTLALGTTRVLVEAQLALRALAGALMVGLGLHLAGGLPRFVVLERLGAPVFVRISPWARALMPVRSVWHALALGALWGWVPCGMVYTAVALAAAAGSPGAAALTMLAFGAGTVPAMLLTGALAGQLSARLAHRWSRRVAGGLVLSFGVMSVAYALATELGGSSRAAVVAECHGR